MKKLAIMMGALLLSMSCFSACNTQKDTSNSSSSSGGEVNPPATVELTDNESLNYAFNGLYKNNELVDEANGFSTVENLTKAKVFNNGAYVTEFKNLANPSRSDVKMELYNGESVRVVNASGGTTFTIPTSTVIADYTIAKYRIQYKFDDVVLTVSSESSNPYTSNSNPWGIYGDEWLMRHLINDNFMKNQGITRTRELDFNFSQENSIGNTEIKKDHDVYLFALKIDDSENIERPYYNIAIIRAKTDSGVYDPKNFTLFVMKSKTDKTEVMDSIIQSFSKIDSKTMPKNYFDAGEAKENPRWNADTKAYYNQLMNTDHINWGAFSYSMPGNEGSLNPSNYNYQNYLNWSKEVQEDIEEAWNYKYDIYPTYNHIGSGTNASNVTAHYFPLEMAKELAGGNGTNGKPVLQFTYQFTLNNNIVADEVTPMFDVLRGKYDDIFIRLAQDIKAYGKPVLFRLNNEMNTDWTSYSGMMTLLDPDIFVMTWQRLYDIFEKQGVDNCIWIWNPIATSCPYSSWGEDLCFFPGTRYVQMLGGTSYEMNNTGTVKSFKEHYSTLYKKNEPAFSQWGMVISEFACGSGGDYYGELGAYADLQAKWVEDMFAEINADNPAAYIKQIKGAVWFNCNDYSGSQITNRLQLCNKPGGISAKEDYSDLTATIEAFRKGLNPDEN